MPKPGLFFFAKGSHMPHKHFCYFRAKKLGNTKAHSFCLRCTAISGLRISPMESFPQKNDPVGGEKKKQARSEKQAERFVSHPVHPRTELNQRDSLQVTTLKTQPHQSPEHTVLMFYCEQLL